MFGLKSNKFSFTELWVTVARHNLSIRKKSDFYQDGYNVIEFNYIYYFTYQYSLCVC